VSSLLLPSFGRELRSFQVADQRPSRRSVGSQSNWCMQLWFGLRFVFPHRGRVLMDRPSSSCPSLVPIRSSSTRPDLFSSARLVLLKWNIKDSPASSAFRNKFAKYSLENKFSRSKIRSVP
jgi:hypothetical protein